MNGPDRNNNLGELPPIYAQCADNFRFQDYGDSMMFCLQANAAIDADGCKSVMCSSMVSRTTMSRVDCRGTHRVQRDHQLCLLADDPDGLPLRCFGASVAPGEVFWGIIRPWGRSRRWVSAISRASWWPVPQPMAIVLSGGKTRSAKVLWMAAC